MQINTEENYLILVGKELKDYLFLLIIIQQMMIVKFLLILSKAIFFQELKLMIEIFMTSQLMIQLNNMMKLEKFQQDGVMSILLVIV